MSIVMRMENKEIPLIELCKLLMYDYVWMQFLSRQFPSCLAWPWHAHSVTCLERERVDALYACKLITKMTTLLIENRVAAGEQDVCGHYGNDRFECILCRGQVTWKRNTSRGEWALVAKQSGFKISLDPRRYCERIRTLAVTIHLWFSMAPPPPPPPTAAYTSLKRVKKKRVKVGDGTTDEGGWRLSAPHLRRCIEG